MADSVKDAWRKYLVLLQRNPLSTKALTACTLSGSTELLTQKLLGARKLQFKRAFLVAFYAGLYGAPFGHFFHKSMDWLFAGKRDQKTIAKKVLVEQLIANPWNNLVFMVYFAAVVEGRPWSYVKQKIRKDYPSVQLDAWKIWPFVSWINHTYVPLHLRVLFHFILAVCWGKFLVIKSAAAIKKVLNRMPETTNMQLESARVRHCFPISSIKKI